MIHTRCGPNAALLPGSGARAAGWNASRGPSPRRAPRFNNFSPRGNRGNRGILFRFIADFVAAHIGPSSARHSTRTVIPREAPAGSPQVQNLQRRPRNLLAHARAPPRFVDPPVQAVEARAPIADEWRGRVPARRGPPARAGRFLGRRTRIQHASASRGASLGMTVSRLLQPNRRRASFSLFPLFPLGEPFPVLLPFSCVLTCLPRSRRRGERAKSARGPCRPRLLSPRPGVSA